MSEPFDTPGPEGRPPGDGPRPSPGREARSDDPNDGHLDAATCALLVDVELDDQSVAEFARVLAEDDPGAVDVWSPDSLRVAARHLRSCAACNATRERGAASIGALLATAMALPPTDVRDTHVAAALAAFAASPTDRVAALASTQVAVSKRSWRMRLARPSSGVRTWSRGSGSVSPSGAASWRDHRVAIGAAALAMAIVIPVLLHAGSVRNGALKTADTTSLPTSTADGFDATNATNATNAASGTGAAGGTGLEGSADTPRPDAPAGGRASSDSPAAAHTTAPPVDETLPAVEAKPAPAATTPPVRGGADPDGARAAVERAPVVTGAPPSTTAPSTNRPRPTTPAPVSSPRVGDGAPATVSSSPSRSKKAAASPQSVSAPVTAVLAAGGVQAEPSAQARVDLGFVGSFADDNAALDSFAVASATATTPNTTSLAASAGGGATTAAPALVPTPTTAVDATPTVAATSSRTDSAAALPCAELVRTADVVARAIVDGRDVLLLRITISGVVRLRVVIVDGCSLRSDRSA